MLFFVVSRITIFKTILFLIFGNSSVSAGNRSQEKCREYGELVYENVESPVLRLDAGRDVVSYCEIIETPLIIGGVEANSDEFPHMAAIGYGRIEVDIVWLCGGSIISEDYVLTAAHCLMSHEKGPARKVRVGVTDLVNPEESMQERNIQKGLKHPNYRLPAKYHDIALLKLDEPLTLNPRVRPACLEIESRLPGKGAIACGFGKTDFEAKEGSRKLMKVQLDYISIDDCEKSFAAELGGRRLPEGLQPGLLCAGVMEGHRDTCQGDSGGPLQRVLEDPYCTYSIVGITSFGKFCGFKNSPAIYTRVSFYVDWIESVVWS